MEAKNFKESIEVSPMSSIQKKALGTAITAKIDVHSLNFDFIIARIFEQQSGNPLELEALIYYVLHRLDVGISSYEMMYQGVKQYILESELLCFEQGKPIAPKDINLRKVLVKRK